MSTKAANYLLNWDLALVDTIDPSQQWILSAMKADGAGLVSMLWRILGNEQDVCDAYQHTFLNLAHRQDVQKPKNVRAYLYRTAANIGISMLRRAQTRQKSHEIIAQTCPTECKTDYAKQLDSKLIQQKLRAAISELPDYLRNVIALRDLGELPYAQVANILGITQATARVYRSKAITVLAVLMGKKERNGC